MRWERIWFWVIPGLSVFLLILFFVPGLNQYAFGYDDVQLFNQGFLRSPWSWQSLKIVMTPGYSSDYYPLRDLSVWIDWTFTNNLMENTTPAKIQNLFWLLGIGFLTFRILILITGQRLFSVIMACAWLLHPFHLESLHWISARKDLMSWFFMLASSFVIFEANSKDKISNRHYSCAILLFVLSVTSKAVFLAVPFGFLLCLMVVSFYEFKDSPARINKFWIGLAAGASTVFAALTYWNYSANNDMKMDISIQQRVLSISAAIGRSVVGAIIPNVNAVDVEPWGGWYLYNDRFIVVGAAAAAVYVAITILAFRHRNTYLLLACVVVGAVGVMTPGINPFHRSFYSIRYFEPMFFIAFIGLSYFLSKKKLKMKLASFVWCLFAFSMMWDAAHWTSNLAIFEKARQVSPQDPAPLNMVLLEIYNRRTERVETSELKMKFVDLFNQASSYCIDSIELNGRCLSFYKYVRSYLSLLDIDDNYKTAILKKSFERTIELKVKLFPNIAKSETAWTVFQKKMFIDGVFDKEALKEYFARHQYLPDGDTRAAFIIFRCLESGSESSNSLFDQWRAQKMIQSADARLFVSEISSPTLRQQAKNCFIKANSQ